MIGTRRLRTDSFRDVETAFVRKVDVEKDKVHAPGFDKTEGFSSVNCQRNVKPLPSQK